MAEIKRVGADSARRVLDVLFAFSEERPIASVKELAEEVGVPLPSAHRYIALLRETGLVAETERSGTT
jgi:DNA-binding IclR family transcriptional regulator